MFIGFQQYNGEIWWQNKTETEVAKEKMIAMKRRTTVRIISFGLAVCAALGGFIAVQWRDNRNLNQLLTNQYTAAMTDLSDCLSQINVLLQKEMYSGTSKGFAELSSHLSQTAGAA